MGVGLAGFVASAAIYYALSVEVVKRSRSLAILGVRNQYGWTEPPNRRE